MMTSKDDSKDLSILRIAVVLAATVVCAGLAAPNVLAAKTKGKMVKRTMRVQDATVNGNGVRVSGYLVPKRPGITRPCRTECVKRVARTCRTAGVNLYKTDAAGNILEGPLASVDTNKKGFWQMFGPTAVTADTRLVVSTKKGPKLKTKEGKWICGRATSAPFAPGLSPGTAPPGTQPPGTQPPPGGSNQSPYFPPQTTTTQPDNEYSIVGGQPCLTSQTLNITISPGATDPDGDPLTYSWTASNGTINGSDLSATWQRVVQNCSTVPGIVTVTASDGRGGTAQIQKSFN